MSEHDQLFRFQERPEDFTFDERVANVFDNMVARSVPFYTEIQRIQADLVIEFLPQSAGVICDLGCSTGTTIEHIIQHPHCSDSAHFIGYDNSVPMLDKARLKLAAYIDAGRVDLQVCDMTVLSALPACHVVILNWTLQFVRPIGRQALIDTVFEALEPGGVLFLSEKILGNDSLLNRVYIDHFLRFKTSQSGYTDTENQRKREALENVLIPYRLDENFALLERAGFKRIDTYFRWFNFACIIAVKT